MADIQSEILSKYGIDIAQEDIFKLYKMDGSHISPQDLEEKIQGARKRWNTSVNGANEKNAERDRVRLEKADRYEKILKDARLRKEVFNFCNQPSGGNAGSRVNPGEDSTEFAKEYFELIATTKKIKKSDVDFFFKYYQAERKNKKAILEMLSKEMKINGLGKEEKYADAKDEADGEGKKKNDSSPLIVNLFQEATVLKIRRAIEKYEEAVQNNELCQRYPKLQEGLFEYLEIKDVASADQFTEIMSLKGKEVYAVRQERGAEYVPLVDLFNLFQNIGDYQDVADNITEFKLLLKYPNLTPYMFSFVEMKPATMKKIVNMANRDYSFRDDADFILNYYKQLHDNFGISDSGISSLLKKAEKKARQNKVLNDIDKKLGRNKNRQRLPIGAEIIHWLTYWPIFAVYFVFEAAKVIFTKLHKLSVPIFIMIFLLESWLLPELGMQNLLILRKIFYKNQWLDYLNDFLGKYAANGLEAAVLSLIVIIILLAVYLLPGLLVSLFIAEFADDFNKRFDWVGLERTFRQMFLVLKKKTEDRYQEQRKLFVRSKIPKIIINIVCMAVLIAAVYFTPSGLRTLSVGTGYGLKSSKEDIISNTDNSSAPTDVPDSSTALAVTAIVITVSSANIRSGPGIDYEIVSTANQGDVFITTGNEESASNGRIWYEIYLDGEMSQTGWASEKVMEFQ